MFFCIHADFQTPGIRSRPASLFNKRMIYLIE